MFVEHPGPPPDFDHCYEFSDTMWSTTDHTFVPFPFVGRRQSTLYAPVPIGWSRFSGTVHLTDIEWTGADWISVMSMSVGNILVARWDDGTWTVYPNQDLMPALSVKGDRLRFRADAKARGTKPAGKQRILATVTAQFCGEGAEYLRPRPL